jgi:hypothetical protein
MQAAASVELGSQPPLDKKSGTTAVCEGLARYAVLNVET